MNRCYRLIWNRARQLFVVGSEISRGRGKTGRSFRVRPVAWLTLLPLGLSPMLVMAASASGAMAPTVQAPRPAIMGTSVSPQGGQVAAGSGRISQNGLTTTIDQHSQNLSLNWQSFDIGAASTVKFVQPNAQSVAVNRIADANGSVILGRLNANGQVFLINPNGVLFGQGAQVNVGGLVASTLNISDSELASGTRHFNGNGNGGVVNRGTINAANGGYIALLGPQVTNQGKLNAPGGTVALAGGNAVTLSFDGNRLLSLQVDKSTLDALADNRQLIVADGGQVLMSAGAKDSLLASVVNNSGTIQARTVEKRAGKIVLLGGMATGTTRVAGALDASAPNGGNGGFIETSAAHVNVADSARVTTQAANGHTGAWLIDPNDFTVANSGGNMTGAAVSSALAGNNFEITTASMGTAGGHGDIFVNDAVSWSGNTFTLNAERNIAINAPLRGSGTGKLALKYGQGAVAAGNVANYRINAAVDLAAGNNFSTRLGSDGDVVHYQVITSLGTTGSVTGTDLQGINGNLTGNYVLGANIDASTTSDWNNSEGFAPIGKPEVDPDPYDPFGSPVPATPFTGSFDGLGHTISGLIINRPSENGVGLFGQTSGADLRNIALLGGSITGKSDVGSLVGDSQNSTIRQAYATGAVTGGEVVGGLVGNSNNSTISQVHTTGAVSGGGSGSGGSGAGVGGLVGQSSSTSISQAYTTGTVHGGNYVGGLLGYYLSGSTITGAFATGAVTGNTAGGLVGSNPSGGAIIAGYWDSYSTGQSVGAGYGSAAGIAAITSDPAQSGAANYAFRQSAYAGFDFTPGSGTWFMVDGSTRPFLQSEYSTAISNTHQLQLMGMDLAATYTLANDLDASATGRAVDSAAPADASGMWSNAGFKPIGDSFPNWFTGSFDGLGHTITGLTINRPGTNYVGLFGATLPGSTISHVGMLGGSVIGGTQVGSLVGRNNGQVDQAYATVTVNGTTYVGGLVGFSAGSITNAFATGAVTGISDVGGLVGRSENGTLSQSYAMGAVSGQANVGGLIGTNWYSTISQTYATGQVAGTGAGIGGLVGWNNSGTTTDSYWATDTSGQSASAGGTAQTLADLIAAMPAGFGTTVWGNQGNQTTPYLLNNVGQVFIVGGGTNFYTPIFTLNQLQAIGSGTVSLSGNYALFGDIDASATGGWNGGAGFDPIGDSSTSFSGGFDGLGHTISGLTIDRSGTDDVGLFGYIGSTAEIRNVGLTNAHVAGKQYVGGLVGYNNGGSINNSYATGQVAGSSVYIGGLVGVHKGSISNSYATATVTGSDLGTGGLVGYSIGTISHSYATGQVVGGGYYTGGLVAVNRGSISDSYATGAVSGGNHVVGGLVGINGQMAGDSASISNSYATGNVSGAANDVGGLVGANYTSISNSYATGTVSGSAQDVGGLVGIQYDGSISQTYAIGAVNGPSAGGSIGGLVGRQNNGTVSSSYWDTETTGQNHSAGSAATFGLSSADMLKASSFADWDMDSAGGGSNVWRIYEGQTGPLLKAFMTSLTVTLGDRTTTYNGQAYDGSGLAYSVADPDLSQLLGSFTDGTARNAGSYTLSGSGLYSGQQGYDIVTGGSGTLTIDKATLTLSGLSAADKVYDATTAATATGSLSGVFGSDDVDATLAASFADKNAGTGKTVTVNGITLRGADAGNYLIAAGQTATADIAKRVIIVGATGTDRVYDGTRVDAVSLATTGVLAGDTVAFTGIGSFADKNVGTAKTLAVTGIAASGADASNYSFNAVAATTANITPATLTYRADGASSWTGQVPRDLSGAVTGLVGGDTLADAADGTLTWNTPANAASPAGQYAIDGSGLSALNYVFAQAPGNATALQLMRGEQVPSGAPLAVTRTVAGLQQQEDDAVTGAAPRTPYTPNIQIVGGGVRLP